MRSKNGACAILSAFPPRTIILWCVRFHPAPSCGACFIDYPQLFICTAHISDFQLAVLSSALCSGRKQRVSPPDCLLQEVCRGPQRGLLNSCRRSYSLRPVAGIGPSQNGARSRCCGRPSIFGAGGAGVHRSAWFWNDWLCRCTVNGRESH